MCCLCFFCQAEVGILDRVRSRGLGDVYKRQGDEDLEAGHEDEHDRGQDAHRHEEHLAGLRGEQRLSLIHI